MHMVIVSYMPLYFRLHEMLAYVLGCYEIFFCWHCSMNIRKFQKKSSRIGANLTSLSSIYVCEKEFTYFWNASEVGHTTMEISKEEFCSIPNTNIHFNQTDRISILEMIHFLLVILYQIYFHCNVVVICGSYRIL